MPLPRRLARIRGAAGGTNNGGSMKGFTWHRLGESAVFAGIFTLAISLGRFLERGERGAVAMMLGFLTTLIVFYLLWPVVGPAYAKFLPLGPKQVVVAVLGGAVGVLAPGIIFRLTG